MTYSSFIKTLWVLFAALFLSAQGFSKAHAIEHIATDHIEDCLVCDVTVSSAEQSALEPRLPTTASFVKVTRPEWVFGGIRRPNHFNNRAPPPRGPPSNE